MNKVYVALARQNSCKPSMSEFIKIVTFIDKLSNS